MTENICHRLESCSYYERLSGLVHPGPMDKAELNQLVAEIENSDSYAERFDNEIHDLIFQRPMLRPEHQYLASPSRIKEILVKALAITVIEAKKETRLRAVFELVGMRADSEVESLLSDIARRYPNAAIREKASAVLEAGEPPVLIGGILLGVNVPPSHITLSRGEKDGSKPKGLTDTSE